MSPLPVNTLPAEGRYISVWYDDEGNTGPVAAYEEVDDTPTFTVDGDTLEITEIPGQPLETLLFVGARQRPHQIMGIAVGDSASFAAADFGALDTHPDPALSIPAFSTAKHLALWYMTTDLEVNVVRVVGDAHNYIGTFGDPVPLTIGGSDGFYIATKTPISIARSETKLLAYNTTGLSTFTRYGALRAAADGSTFAATDFTGTDGFSSTTGVVQDSRTAPDVGAALYQAVAVPDGQRDVTGILAPGFGGYELELFAQFERQPGTIEISGIDYKVWRSTTQFFDVVSMNVLIQQVAKL